MIPDLFDALGAACEQAAFFWFDVAHFLRTGKIS